MYYRERPGNPFRSGIVFQDRPVHQQGLAGCCASDFCAAIDCDLYAIYAGIVQNCCVTPHRPGHQSGLEYGSLLGSGIGEMVYPAKMTIRAINSNKRS